MSYQREIIYGGVRVRVYGGIDEIGGNCVVIEEGERKVVFDNGIRFSIIRKFYGGRIEPFGPFELRSVGAIPPLDAFEEASAVYVSHFHLDHVGLLSMVPLQPVIKVPSVSILEKTLARWYKASSSWLAYVPPDFSSKIGEVEPWKEDENKVVPVPVSHSCYPAYSFLYVGESATIFYSGDLRFEPLSFIRFRLSEALERVGVDRVDVAILEGTNFSEDYASVTASTFRNYLSMLLKEYDLVSISIDPLDLETFIAILDLSQIMEKNLVIGSSRLTWIIEEVEKLRPEVLDKIYFCDELEISPTLLIRSISLSHEVIKNPDNFLLIVEPVEILSLLRKLKMWGELQSLAGSIVVLTDPEPRETVKEVEEKVLKTWLKSFGMQIVRLRLSGHYLPHEFRSIIGTLKPKELLPIHTEEADLMRKLFRRFSRESKK
ncbi:MBL fold metallo-hydrolase [Thermofilum sp.]|uniref:MBL fold metallo-hydrolase n=1 Tax=Thermofilum sp. TaxID=1961369 RepID=UPI00316352DA